MPKINVYLPDDLAEQVRAAKLPVSAICQAALSDALRHAAAATEAGTAAAADLPGDLAFPVPVTRHFAQAVTLAVRAAGDRRAAEVEPSDLLQGLLHERESVTLKMVESLGVDPAAIQARLDERVPPPDPGAARRRRGKGPALGARARDVLDAAEHEATAGTGRPLITCAHLLLALLAGDGPAGSALRAAGLDGPDARRAVAAMRSGLTYGRATPGTGAPAEAVLADIVERLERIESRLGA
jgi:ATP-dependent Clp protease ATP-binding subunit ClpC